MGPSAFHFAPLGLDGDISTIVYALPVNDEEFDESSLASTRLVLHRHLNLPVNQPLLRICAAMNEKGTFGAPASSNGRLRNVHESGLLKSHVQGGTTHLVRGGYDYYHYMQDTFNDNGWGCAYRSLQTLFSWFRIQNYIGIDVPSHTDIQTCLVKIGDKPRGFIGSKQWIGAIELGYVLDELAGISYKIMNVPSGRELPSKARELVTHFDRIGTPVMMGGGVLAFTLLGIDYNESTGDCAFLILDPHYTGTDDIKSIIPRWCGWKKAEDVFALKDFYNLLMPQAPREV